MARSMWGGSITFGLVNVPVRLYSAVSPKSISFNMLRKSDGSRIKYKKVGATDNKEVTENEIVKGYEVSSDHYVTFTQEEIDALEPESSHSIAIEKFVDPSEIDALYFDRAYYLAPDKTSTKAYALLLEAMKASRKVAIAHMVFHNKEHLVMIRTVGKAMVIQTLHYEDEINAAEDLDNIPKASDAPNKKELEIAQQLIEAISEKFEPENYKDAFRDRVLEAVKQKSEGKTLVAEPVERKSKGTVVSLMEALQASLAQSKKPAKPSKDKAPAKHAAHGKRKSA